MKDFKLETKDNINAIFRKYENEKAEFQKMIADKEHEFFEFKSDCQME